MDEATDEELMERFGAGDARAFDALYTRHAPGVQAFLQRMVGDRTMAEDLLQTTFLSVVRSSDRYERGAKVAPWLFSIAANAARDALRRRRRAREEASTDEVPETAVAASQPDPALQKRLNEALGELPVEQREAVLLHRLLGWTFEEVADALGSNASTVRVRAHRGFEKLRARLGDLWEAER